jgi:3D (Asp-Asp-Asp) domain-containing protein/peptidoglycan hydrolase CwlO-like protein
VRVCSRPNDGPPASPPGWDGLSQVRHPNRQIGWKRCCSTHKNRPEERSSDLWYLPALVRAPGRGLRTFCLAVVAATAVGASLVAAGSAETVADLEAQARALERENAQLETSSQSALGGLAGIEARLAQTRAELASLRSRAAVVRSRRRSVNEELAIVRVSARTTQAALARRLQALYEEGDADPLAVILGAGSLAEALNAIETLDFAAKQDQDLLRKARSATTRLARLTRALAARQRELEQLAAARAAAAASLAAARAERLQTIAAMRSASRSNSAQIVGLEERARSLASVQSVSAPVALGGSVQVQPGASAPSGVGTMTVVATGYALPGTTSSGRPVGWGSVAVDPSVIPLGSRLSIPGYGVGVAADTGGAIQGARIDLWFPSVAQARAWGTRVVTITVYA